MLKDPGSTKFSVIALSLASATIIAALASEVFGKLVPCELCLTQRIPYYLGIPLLIVGLVAPDHGIRVGFRLGALAFFLWGAYLGFYHSGVEWKLWAGPSACAGTGTPVGFDALSRLNEARVVACDQAQFRFLGLSLAGWNAAASLSVGILIAMSLRLRRRPVAQLVSGDRP